MQILEKINKAACNNNMSYKGLLLLMLFVTIIFSNSGVLISSANESNYLMDEQYHYLRYDSETGEMGDYSCSINNDISQTWDLFDSELVKQMQNDLAMNECFRAKPGMRSILGEDNRFFSPPTSSPYSSVVYLRAFFDTDNDGISDIIKEGSGFLVSKKVMVTAAHCMIPQDTSSENLLELRIYLNLDSSTLIGKTYVHPKTWTWSTNWHNPSLSWKYDYCVVELWDDVTKPFYFNCVGSSNAYTPQYVNVSGYPGDHSYYQMSCFGQMTYTDYYTCEFNNDIIGGMSGGPIYNINNCLGIITYESSTYNQGNLFTSYLYNLICSIISDNE
ncbi:MAG: trypsin-like peptidase domain-containing protein [Lachnospiraceae bacterium]|nr:trypsin-like peptidase domain-containing protein [Lachnospiraceae bacterium]